MTVSICLASYNGERFLQEQLQSILQQTGGFLELIIRDDGSSDSTREIVDVVSKGDARIRLQVSAKNSGATENFAKAVALAEGSIVALADQDDVWEAGKIELIESTLTKNPDVGYVFSNARRIDENAHELRGTLWDSLPIPFDKRQQIRFTSDGGFRQLLRGNVVTGCTMAFRSEYKNLVLPIPNIWVHDAWIAVCISAVSRGLPLNQRLVRYRQHGDQQIGERRRGFLQQYRMAAQMDKGRFEQDLACYEILLERLTSQSRWPVEEWKIDLLRRKICFLSDRCRIRTRWCRLPLIVKNIINGGYQQFAFGWKSVAQDLLIRR